MTDELLRGYLNNTLPKIRAYDKVADVMSYGVPEYRDDSIEYRFYHFEGLNEDSEDVVFMLSTGVKDKNDIEAYDKDIVEVTQSYIGDIFEKFRGKVAHEGKIEAISMKNGVPLVIFEKRVPLILPLEVIEFRVIGNIFQNRELVPESILEKLESKDGNLY